MLNQLTQPTNSRSHYGALMACVRKVRDGHLSPDQLVKVVAVIGDAVQPSDTIRARRRSRWTCCAGCPGRCGGRHGPPAARGGRGRPNPARGARGRPAGRQRPVEAGRQPDRAGDPGRAAREPVGFTDELLPVLVDEMLFAPVLDAALHSALLLRSSPYGPAVASAIAAELATPRVVSDPPLANAMLAALRIVGQAEQRPLVERLALTPGLRSDVVSAAISCLAHIGGSSPDKFWLTALERHGLAWRRYQARQSVEALTTLVYGLGIAHNLQLLALVRADDQAPPPVRRAAGWWLDRPARFYDSVRS